MPRPILKKINIIDIIKKSLDFIKLSSKSSIDLVIRWLTYIKDADQLNRVLLI